MISFGLLSVGFEKKKFAKIKSWFSSCVLVLGDDNSRAEMVM